MSSKLAITIAISKLRVDLKYEPMNKIHKRKYYIGTNIRPIYIINIKVGRIYVTIQYCFIMYQKGFMIKL